MKKKIALGISLSLVAIILIVCIVVISVIFSKDLTGDIVIPDKEYSVGASGELVVASYNVKSWDSTKENLNAMREQLKAHDVDIAGLQEIDTDTSLRSKKNKCTSTLASDVYTEHYFAPTRSLFLGDGYGIMSVSQHKINESGKAYLPMPSRWFMIIGEPRVCLRTVINVDGTDVAFYNTHLSFENNIKMKGGKEMRAAQIEFIYNLMEIDPCEYKVLVGDFNLLDFDELDIFTNSGKYCKMNNADTPFNSYRGDDVTFKCLDNIVYTSNFELVEAHMIDNDLSDHNMLYAKLKI